MPSDETQRAALVDYAQAALRGGAIYRGYRPRASLIEAARASLPAGHIDVVSAPWCGDCRREVPKVARILQDLPDWTVRLVSDDDPAAGELGVRAIPTFVVRDGCDGRELGRIVESPSSPDGLEGDLARISALASQRS